MALLNYTPPSDNPATGKTLNVAYLAYLTDPNETTTAAFKAARHAYQSGAKTVTTTAKPSYSAPTHTPLPEAYKPPVATAYVPPQTLSTTPAPQFSAATSTQPKKTSFKNKVMLGAMFLIGLNFSDELNQTYDKIVGKKPQKTHGVGLASLMPTAQATSTNVHFTDLTTKKVAVTAVEKATTIQVKTNQNADITPIALPDNTDVSTNQSTIHTVINTSRSPDLSSIAAANDALKDFESYYQHFLASPKPEGFSPSPEKILTLYNIIKNESPKAGYAEKPTTGGRYDSARHSKKLRGNGGGASGAYQFMASTWVAMGILEKVGKTLKTKPSKAHLVCDQLNQKAAEDNEPYVYIPTVNKKGRSTGKYYKLALTDEAKEVSGLENATDIYTTAAGAALQDYGACKLMLSNDKYISYNTKTDPVKYGQACAKLWYHGPKGSNRKPPYAHWHLFKEQLKELTKFNGNKINTTVYADTTTQNTISPRL